MKDPNQKYIDAWAAKFQDDIKKAYIDQVTFGVGFLKVENGILEYVSLQDAANHIQFVKERLKENKQ